MKGLLIKDYKLLKNQKNFLILIFLIGMFFCYTNDSLTSGISYILFVLTFSTISTFSYDEAEDCMMFLMTLPAGRKEYVKEKYVFGMINPFICYIILVVAGCIFELCRGKGVTVLSELIVSSVIMLFLAWILFAFYLPIQLKFGSEKTRVVILVFTGASVGAGYLLFALNVTKYVSVLFDKLSGINEYMVTGIIGGLSITVTVISYLISQNIMKMKEF